MDAMDPVRVKAGYVNWLDAFESVEGAEEGEVIEGEAPRSPMMEGSR